MIIYDDLEQYHAAIKREVDDIERCVVPMQRWLDIAKKGGLYRKFGFQDEDTRHYNSDIAKEIERRMVQCHGDEVI